MTTTIASRSLKSSRRPRAGFSFTEVLFAVMVLGIGFIMVAAMFPVTISQTQQTLRESVGANVARGAIDYLQSVGTNENFPPTDGSAAGMKSTDPYKPLTSPPAVPLVVSMRDANLWTDPVAPGSLERRGWLATRDNYICAQDPRYAWVPLYMRGSDANGPSPYAQVFVVVLQARNRDAFIPQIGNSSTAYSDVSSSPVQNDTHPLTGLPYTALEPRLIPKKTGSTDKTGISLAWDKDRLHGVMSFHEMYKHLAATGAYVIVADDQNKTYPKKLPGASNGRIYRLGNFVREDTGDGSTWWELAPDGDMIHSQYNLGDLTIDTSDKTDYLAGDDNRLKPDKTDAYIIGPGYLDPLNAPTQYGGSAQEIGVYTGFIRIK